MIDDRVGNAAVVEGEGRVEAGRNGFGELPHAFFETVAKVLAKGSYGAIQKGGSADDVIGS